MLIKFRPLRVGLSVKKKEEFSLRKTAYPPAKTIDFTLLVLTLSLRTLM